eukprot:Em0010g11a
MRGAPAFHPYGSQQYPSRAAPKLVYSGAPTAAGSSQGVLSAAGWHQILGSREGELDQQATSSSFNVLAELEAIRHKRDEAAQQNEAPVAGSVEGQSVPACKNRDTGEKSGLVKTVQPYWRQQPGGKSVKQ